MKELALLKWKEWHLSCKYFIGELNKDKIFLKTDNALHILGNEIAMYELLLNHNAPVPSYYGNVKCAGESLILLEAVNGKGLNEYLSDNLPLTSSEVVSIARQLVFIIETLRVAGVVHRDLTSQNLLVSYSKNGMLRLVLIDMAFAVNVHTGVEIDQDIPRWVLKRLGGKYRLKDNMWDDVYSVIIIIKELQKAYQVDLRTELTQLERYRGTLIYPKNHGRQR